MIRSFAFSVPLALVALTVPQEAPAFGVEASCHGILLWPGDDSNLLFKAITCPVAVVTGIGGAAVAVAPAAVAAAAGLPSPEDAKHNFTVGVLTGGFFGAHLGAAMTAPLHAVKYALWDFPRDAVAQHRSARAAEAAP